MNIIEEEISNCNLCDPYVEKFQMINSIYYGINNDIVILGEAPANNGWRKSGIPFYDINGNILPSGKVLTKLLDIIGIKLEDVTFLEAIKCYPLDRKYLKFCSKNCISYLFGQLEYLNPRVVLILGEVPTRMILDMKGKKFKDVVGKEFLINNIKFIPIYHPSPISPLSYNGNYEIFESLKECNLVLKK